MNVSPYGFFHYGSDFFHTAKESKQTIFSPVPYYLYCHAIELLLKAFLLAKGVPKEDLPKRDQYGHDLEKTLKKALELGLRSVVTITQEQENEIEKANTYYSSKGFEYFDVTKALEAYPELPNLLVLHQVASELVTQLKPICLNC